MKFRAWMLVSVMLGALGGQARAADLTGIVKDGTGAVLPGAKITVLSPQRAVVATTSTDQFGKYAIKGLPDGQYVVVVQFKGLADARMPVTLSGSGAVSIDPVLRASTIEETVTVTANPGQVRDRGTSSQPVTVISGLDVAERAMTVVAQAVEGEAGVHLQRTSSTMAGVYVRGLTGNKVNLFIDGVRYSTGAQRGGVSTFLDLIDPSVVDGIEILRGTASAQYGSDALGGSVQFLTPVPSLAIEGQPRFGGQASFGATSAHQGANGSALFRYSGKTFGVSGSIGASRTGNLRPGQGIDSHAAVTRFLGVPSNVLYPERLPNTEFHQTSGQVKANWTISPNTVFVASYIGTRQDGGKRSDQLDGGDGNLISDLNDMRLDLFYARFERLKAGWFDRLSLTYSFNTQREERVNQGGQGSSTATIGHEPERTTVHGLQFNASRAVSLRQSLFVGADVYLESLESKAFNVNPTTQVTSARRPRVPDGATYRQSGVFVQDTFKLNRLTFDASARVGTNRYRAEAADSPLVGGAPLWPDDSLDATSVTFRAGAAITLNPSWTMTTSLSSGYRAPHMTDLGTLGLTGSGFEVAAPDVAGLGGFVGSSASASAVSSGKPVEQVKAERSLSYDAGLSFRRPRARMNLNVFVNKIYGNIQKQALILPAGAVGTMIGGQPVTTQNPSGSVLVALSTSPVLVRANFDDARIWGVEWSGELASNSGSLRGGLNYTYIRAIDTATRLPPNIEGGTPAPGGSLWVRFMPEGARWWTQPYIGFASIQTHLSSLDLDDRRTGASRTRASIQNFFRNGALNRGFISAGADGVFGNADDILIATGETLAEIQDRVLGVGVNSSSLFTAVPGHVTFGVRFGMQIKSHTFLVDAENLGDKNYRGISWGMDAPGRGISFKYIVGF